MKMVNRSLVEYTLMVGVAFRELYHRSAVTVDTDEDHLKLIRDTICEGFDAEAEEKTVARQLWESGAVI